MKANIYRLLFLTIVAFVCMSQAPPLERILSPTSPQTDGDFGEAVTADGSFAAIGEPGSNVVRIYSISSANFIQEVAQVSPGAAVAERFGQNVKLNGDLLIVGAPSENIQGKAFIYRRITNTQWNLEAELTASDGSSGDLFGGSVAIDADWAIIGAEDHINNTETGSAYAFRRASTGIWSEFQKLNPSGLEAFGDFGHSVAIDGIYAAVGAQYSSELNPQSGSVYTYTYVSVLDKWSQSGKLLPTDSTQAAAFGSSVDIDGSLMVVGSDGDRTLSGFDYEPYGSVSVFVKLPGGWIKSAKIHPPIPHLSDRFGNSVAISGTRIIVGAKFDKTITTDLGRAYIYNYNSPAWNLEYELSPGDYDPNYPLPSHQNVTLFGNSVGISNDLLVVGRDYFTGDGKPQAANVYRLPPFITIAGFIDISPDLRTIPQYGASFEYNITYTNPFQERLRFTRNIDLNMPDGKRITLERAQTLVLSPDEEVVQVHRFEIPRSWPAGGYQIVLSWSDESGSYQEIATFEKVGNRGRKQSLSEESSNRNGIESIPQIFRLEQNYPNPFNPITTIAYQLPEESDVRLTIYNVRGQQVRSAVSGRQAAGNREFIWNGLDDSGEAVASGVYLYRLHAGEAVLTRKMLLAR